MKRFLVNNDMNKANINSVFPLKLNKLFTISFVVVVLSSLKTPRHSMVQYRIITTFNDITVCYGIIFLKVRRRQSFIEYWSAFLPHN